MQIIQGLGEAAADISSKNKSSLYPPKQVSNRSNKFAADLTGVSPKPTGNLPEFF